MHSILDITDKKCIRVKTSAIFSVPLIWIGYNSLCCFASLIVWSSRASDVKSRSPSSLWNDDDEKKISFFFPFLDFFLDAWWKIHAFSPLWFPQKNTSLSLSCVCVVLLYYTLYKKRARGGVKLFFSRFYNRIKLLSLFFSERRERQSATKRGLFCF